MADHLSLLARELGVPTAKLRAVLGTGWVRLGQASPVFNGRLGPTFADSADDPRVGIRSMSAVSCVDLEAGPMMGVTIGVPVLREGERGMEWDVVGRGSDCWWDNDDESETLYEWLAEAFAQLRRPREVGSRP